MDFWTQLDATIVSDTFSGVNDNFIVDRGCLLPLVSSKLNSSLRYAEEEEIRLQEADEHGQTNQKIDNRT
jgi:hypothetical protein